MEGIHKGLLKFEFQQAARYDWGALTKDESRGITDIVYDNFGNPERIVFSNGSYTKIIYSAVGVKLKTEHYTNLGSSANAVSSAMDMDMDADAAVSTDVANAISGTERIEYHGPVIYRNGSIHMVRFPGGYATISGSTVTFHYYTQDYLGNNRAVVNGTTGAIEQTTAYYPYGAVIADLGTGNSGQPFKFIGKELISANSLNEYDFGARRHYPAVPHFTSIDPLCENYPWLSPYLYCANNPVNFIDPTGKVVIGLDEQAQQNIIYTLSEEEARYVKFNEGKIDVDLLNQCESTSENMTALKGVANSETIFYVATASQYESGNRTRDMKSINNAGGTIGATLMPDAEFEPSPDNDVHIYTSNMIPIVDQVENTAHELYGHGYFYDLKMQGNNVNPSHDYQSVTSLGDYIEEMKCYDVISVRVDMNKSLDTQINKAVKQAKNNYYNRRR